MRRDDAYLLDILIAARKALAFVADMTWEVFEIVDVATVWDTVQNNLPPLIALIEPLVPSEDEI